MPESAPNRFDTAYCAMCDRWFTPRGLRVHTTRKHRTARDTRALQQRRLQVLRAQLQEITRRRGRLLDAIERLRTVAAADAASGAVPAGSRPR